MNIEIVKQQLQATGKRLATIWVVALGLSACVSMPPNDNRTSSTALESSTTTDIGKGVQEAVAQNDGKSGVLLLNNGLDAFVARAKLAQAARQSLDVQYYLFHRDLSGKLLLNELLKAADRGVRVRLLIDDMDMADTDIGVAVLDAHPNMEVRLFNPFARHRTRLGQYLFRFGSVTRRMHNKSFTADNAMTIIGGRNVGNEYFGADSAVAFADMDALLAGPAAKEVSKSFDLYWNNALSYPISNLGTPPPSDSFVRQTREDLDQWAHAQSDSTYMKALTASNLNRAIIEDRVNYEWAPVDIYYDLPEKITAERSEKHLHLGQHLAPYFRQSQQEVVIISPYFVPGKSGTEQLCNMERRGVEVNVLTNSLASTDVSVVHAGYLRYRKRLLKCGVSLFEANSKIVMLTGTDTEEGKSKSKGKKLGLSRTSLHAKMFVFDRRYTFVGSLNLDPRSVTENTEIGSIIDSTLIGEKVAAEIIASSPKIAFKLSLDDRGKVRWDGFEDGQPVSYSKEPHTGFFKRMSTQIMRILPIESQI